MDNNTIYYHCPDFYTGYPIYKYLLQLQKDYPYVFYDNVKITSIFGSFPNMIWNGGTIFGSKDNKYLNEDVIIEMINTYNKNYNIPIRFTFTNPVLEKEHCYDYYCNRITELAYNNQNEILITSPILEEFLKTNYPNYKYCKSIIASENEPYDTEQKYYMSVLQRAKNNDWDYLNTIPQEHRKNIELLCNDPCPDNCPYIYSHYKIYGKVQITHTASKDEPITCKMTNTIGRFPHFFSLTQKNSITRDKILLNYLPKGFNQFKLSGRLEKGTIIAILLEHLIKPEYQFDVLAELIETIVRKEC